jgi:hypothetical protein
MIRNPFKIDYSRRNFDGVVKAYETKGRMLFYPDGSRCNGNSFAADFWRGYDGINAKQWDTESRKMLGYVFFRAGQLVRKNEVSA